MKKFKDLKLYLYLLICLLGVGIIVSSIALITKNKALQNSVSTVSNLNKQNKTFRLKLTQLELTSSRLEDKNKQLQSDMDDIMKLQILETDSEKQTSQFKEILNQKTQQYSALKEEYNTLNQAYNDLLKEGLTYSGRQQPRQDAQRGERPRQEEIEQLKTSIRERTYETLDDRISQAKTEYEVGVFTEMKQKYDNIFDLSDRFRTTEGEERIVVRNSIAEEWIALARLYQDYNDYKWKSLAEEFGVTNTDEFIKRVEEIQASFGDRGGRSGRQQR